MAKGKRKTTAERSVIGCEQPDHRAITGLNMLAAIVRYAELPRSDPRSIRRAAWPSHWCLTLAWNRERTAFYFSGDCRREDAEDYPTVWVLSDVAPADMAATDWELACPHCGQSYDITHVTGPACPHCGSGK